MKLSRLLNFITYISAINLTTEWISYQLRENREQYIKLFNFLLESLHQRLSILALSSANNTNSYRIQGLYRWAGAERAATRENFIIAGQGFNERVIFVTGRPVVSIAGQRVVGCPVCGPLQYCFQSL